MASNINREQITLLGRLTAELVAGAAAILFLQVSLYLMGAGVFNWQTAIALVVAVGSVGVWYRAMTSPNDSISRRQDE